MTFMWTTVSTRSCSSSLAIEGLRMSARTNRTPAIQARGGTTSSPMTSGADG